jgi:futalosine hydrolase
MNILVTAATPIEIAPFVRHLGKSKMTGVDVLISGIGLTATVYHLSKQLQLKRPDLVVQAGVSGCFDSKIPLGTVLAVRRETIADQSVIELNELKTLFDLKLVPRDQFPFKNGWLENGKGIVRKSGLKRVTGISVNEITTSPEKIRFYRSAFRPVVESMEGAALHYTCLMENIAFLQLRSVSNFVGERDKRNWDMKKSIIQLNRELIRIVGSLERVSS